MRARHAFDRSVRSLAGRSWFAAGLWSLWALVGPAAAHGMPGSQATLEGIPSWLYLGSGATVVVLSFAMVGVFVRRETESFSYSSRLLDLDLGVARSVARVVAVGLYVFVVVTGLFGPDDIRINHAPPFLTEVYWWVSFGIFVILVGDVWPAINPWKTLFEWAGEPSLHRPYPEWLGALPALVGFLVFSWLNMVVLALSSPQLAGGLALLYGAVMWVGMTVYGKETWLWNGDAFTRVFDFFGRFAPLQFTRDGVEARGYAVGLVEESVGSREAVFLVVALLYALSFDGFKETTQYFGLLDAISPGGIQPPILSTAIFGGTLLLAGFALFVGAYAVVAWAMKWTAESDREVGDVMERFVLTLVPIAVAYHVAHYSLYYFLQHELLVGVLLNPLPGTEIPTDPSLAGFLSPQIVWYYMVALIVVGHVVAVWVAHHVSMEYFEDHRAAVKSQVPMLMLMVFYTVVSLWIISQPFGG